jgi:hypothetical protein
MRKYLVSYWAEKNDCAEDLDKEVSADNITDALEKFKEENVYKRITSIVEIY